jgi:hypothetical protein
MGIKLVKNNYDVKDMSCGRVLRQHLFGKVRPLWCFSDELEVKHIVALAARHYMGYPVAYLTTRFNPQWQRVLAGWRRLRPGPAGKKV